MGRSATDGLLVGESRPLGERRDAPQQKTVRLRRQGLKGPARGSLSAADPPNSAPVLHDRPAVDHLLQGQTWLRVSGHLAGPIYAIVARDQQDSLPLRRTACVESGQMRRRLLDAYCSLDADALFMYRARGVIYARLCQHTWDAREFVVKDCDGRLLAFGADRSSHVSQELYGRTNSGASRWLFEPEAPTVVQHRIAFDIMGLHVDGG